MAAAAKSRTARKRLLLVKEAGAARSAARVCLQSAGYQVDEAPDAASALLRLARRRGRYALIVVDLAASDDKGLVEAARGGDPRLPVVVVVPAEAPRRSRRKGVAHVRRPFTTEEIQEAMARAMAEDSRPPSAAR